MNLTARGKWLTGIAAGIAAWVLFGPKEPDAVEASAEPAKPTVHSKHAPASAHAPLQVAGLVPGLAHRVADPTTAPSLFPVQTWFVPPPPPPVVQAAPVAPPKPTAPPLPYQFMGSYKPDGQPMVIFLTNGDRVYDVHVGDTLDNTYSVDSFSNGRLVFTYKPLNEQQQLTTGVAQ
jgi:hypothetical protein